MRTHQLAATATAALATMAVTGLVVGATLPANAAQKGDERPTAAAAGQVRTGPASTPVPGGAPAASRNLTTGDGCSSYSDGHGDLCLWYFSSYSGSATGFLRNDANLADDKFVGAGTGQGSLVTNNAESGWNYDRFATVYVATSPGYTGSVGYISPWSGGNLNSTYKNNVESIYWAS